MVIAAERVEGGGTAGNFKMRKKKSQRRGGERGRDAGYRVVYGESYDECGKIRSEDEMLLQRNGFIWEYFYLIKSG